MPQVRATSKNLVLSHLGTEHGSLLILLKSQDCRPDRLTLENEIKAPPILEHAAMPTDKCQDHRLSVAQSLERVSLQIAQCHQRTQKIKIGVLKIVVLDTVALDAVVQGVVDTEDLHGDDEARGQAPEFVDYRICQTSQQSDHAVHRKKNSAALIHPLTPPSKSQKLQWADS